MWPLIFRELKSNSRQRGTYYLRMFAAGLAIAMCWWFFFTISIRIGLQQQGGMLFQGLHPLLLMIIGVVVPLMTMDCVSREKREGTLGLLFLTNLTARQIIYAKVIAHGLRAATLWLAVVPVMALPMLMGGLDWRQVALSLLFTLEFTVLSLLVGVTVSALTRHWISALVLALFLSCGFAWTLAMGNLAAVLFGLAFPHLPWRSIDLEQAFLLVGAIQYRDWITSFGSSSATKLSFCLGLAAFAVVLLLFVWLTFLIIAAYLQRNWQDKPKTRRQERVEKQFYTPIVALGLFRLWMRRSLDRNPIGWLEKRSLNGRIAGWVWLAIMISLATSVVSYGGLVEELFSALMWALLLSLAYVAAASFKRERETGALELILVTPLKESTITWGRLWGVWGIFLPAFVLWAAAIVYCFSWMNQWRPTLVLNFTGAFLALPVVGLYFSLRSRVVLLAWLATLAVGIFAPWLVVIAVRIGWRLFWSIVSGGRFPVAELNDLSWLTPIVQLSIAGFALWRLHLLLVRRTFSFRIA